MKTDFLIIGSGIAGLTAARMLLEAKKDVLVASKSTGASWLSSGAIDVASYLPERSKNNYKSAQVCIEEIIQTRSNHPYSRIGKNAVVAALKDFADAMRMSSLAYSGTLDHNIMLTTMLGTLKPTCLAPPLIYAGKAADLSGKSILIVSIKGYPDFNAGYYAKALQHALKLMNMNPIQEVKTIDVSLPSLENHANLLSMTLARKLEQEKILDEFITQIRLAAGAYKPDLVGFPPILGVDHSTEVASTLNKSLNAEIYEILAFPPSVPGYRLQRAQERLLVKLGGTILNNLRVLKPNIQNGNIKSVNARHGEYKTIEIEAKTYILATGGFIGGGLLEKGNYLHEPLFNLPLFDLQGKNIQYARFQTLLSSQVLPSDGHNFIACGAKVNEELQPVNDSNDVVYSNLRAIGGVLSGYNYIAEKSGLGVAISTGYHVGTKLS